jgi:hypothetical protein
MRITVGCPALSHPALFQHFQELSSTASSSRAATKQSNTFLKVLPGVEPCGLHLPPVDRR